MSKGDRLAITLVGINFEPEQTGIAPYSSGLARGLKDRGHSVRVVTTYPHYPQWRVAPGYSGWRQSSVEGGIHLTRLRHYVPSRPTGVRRAVSELSFGVRAVGTRWGSPDVVIAVSPALISSLMVLKRATARPSAATGILIQDLYSAGAAETNAGGGVVTDVLSRLERSAVRAADGVCVIHDRFRTRTASSFDLDPEKISVVRNWTHVPPAVEFDHAALRQSLGWGTSKVVLHAGAMGEKQGLANVVEAARLADSRESDVLFVLLGDGGQRRRLQESASGISRIKFLDPLPGDLYGQAMRAADVLLVNERPGVVEMAVPSKLTSYFSTGVPVLAATDDRSTTSEEIAAAGAGVVTGPGHPAGLLDAVELLCADHTRARHIGEQGPKYCARVLSEEIAIDGYEHWIYELVERAARRRGER